MRVLILFTDKLNHYPEYRVASKERNTASFVGILQYFHPDKSIGFTICGGTISELFRGPLIVFFYD